MAVRGPSLALVPAVHRPAFHRVVAGAGGHRRLERALSARYVALAAAPRAWGNDHHTITESRPTMFVHETDPTPEPTGLLDQHGVPLYRVEERERLGFGL